MPSAGIQTVHIKWPFQLALIAPVCLLVPQNAKTAEPKERLADHDGEPLSCEQIAQAAGRSELVMHLCSLRAPEVGPIGVQAGYNQQEM